MPLVAVDRIQASSVMPAVRLSRLLEATVTQLLVPLKLSALPNLPCGVQVAPAIVPVCPLPDASVTLAPLPWSNPYAATRPGAPPTAIENWIE